MNEIEQCNTLDGDLPRYILEPFEIISSSDPRYTNAYTYAEVMAMNDKPSK